MFNGNIHYKSMAMFNSFFYVYQAGYIYNISWVFHRNDVFFYIPYDIPIYQPIGKKNIYIYINQYIPMMVFPMFFFFIYHYNLLAIP